MKSELAKASAVLAMTLSSVILQAQWNMVRFDEQNVYSSIAMTGSETVYALGTGSFSSDYFVLRSNDGGTTWDSIPLNAGGSSWQLTSLFTADENTAFAGGLENNSAQAFLKTTDNGNSWENIAPDPASPDPVSAIYFSDAAKGMVSDSHNLYQTVDGGLTWSSHPAPMKVTDIHFTNAQTGFICGSSLAGNYALVMKTENGGQDWTPVLTDISPGTFDFQFGKFDQAGANTLFTSRQYLNSLFRSIDGGNTWSPIVVDEVWEIIDFDFVSATEGHILSSMGEIFSTVDGGDTWELEYSSGWGFYGPSLYLLSLTREGPVGYVAGTSGLIKKYRKGSVGVDEQDDSGNFSIYPNPVSSSEAISIRVPDPRMDYHVRIMNTSGQVVYQDMLTAAGGNGSISTGDVHLSPGMYYVTLQSGKKTDVQKFIVAD